MWGEITLVTAKDLRIERRSRVGLTQIAPFAVTVLVLFGFALEGDSATGVTDLAGNPLQGNCPDGNSGDGGSGEAGPPGRDYCEVVPILAGDATRDGRVNALDLAYVRRHLNARSTGASSNRYDVFADVNADAAINALDLALVRQRLNSALPDGSNSGM